MFLVLKEYIKSPKGRIFIIFFVPIITIAIFVFVYIFRDYFICPIYKITGLYCPGCGSGRTFLSLLHFDFLGAIKQNILTVLGIPLVAYYFLKLYLDFVFNREILPLFKTSITVFNITIAFIFLFGVLRNIPIYPFNILAPS